MDRHFDLAQSEIADLFKTQRDIQRAIRRKQSELLRTLPARVGFEHVDDLIRALAPFASSELRKGVSKARSKAVAKRIHRYGTDVRTRVRHDLESGRSISAISSETGVSRATITKWKRLMGVRVKRQSRVAQNGAQHATMNAQMERR